MQFGAEQWFFITKTRDTVVKADPTAFFGEDQFAPYYYSEWRGK
jgi:hypothetical protein